MSETRLIAVQRTLKLMELLAEQPAGMSFGDIESQLDVSAASLTRLLKMLIDERWLEISANRKYISGHRIQNIMRGLSGRWTEGELVAPLVKRLAGATGQSACFAVYANYGFVLLAKSEMASSYHFIATNVVNEDIVTNGAGLAVLAYLDDETRTEILRRKTTEAERPHVISLLEKIKAEPVHVSKENIVTRLIAPVCNLEDDRLIGVVSLAMLGDANANTLSNMSRELLKTSAGMRAHLSPGSHQIFELSQAKNTA